MAMTPPDLDVYDVAFLAGGVPRVVDTAIVALVRSGRLRVHTPGQLATADLTRRHPVEAAVLDAVGPAGHRSADTVAWRLADDDRLLAIGPRLREAGLLGRLSGLTRLSRDRKGPGPTRAGQRVLREMGEGLALGDPETTRVALGGRAAMSDPKLRADIFEPPPAPAIPRTRRPSRREVAEEAAYRTGAYGITGGSASGGGFSDGGFAGFDGGGGGGDGGGM